MELDLTGFDSASLARLDAAIPFRCAVYKSSGLPLEKVILSYIRDSNGGLVYIPPDDLINTFTDCDRFDAAPGQANDDYSRRYLLSKGEEGVGRVHGSFKGAKRPSKTSLPRVLAGSVTSSIVFQFEIPASMVPTTDGGPSSSLSQAAAMQQLALQILNKIVTELESPDRNPYFDHLAYSLSGGTSSSFQMVVAPTLTVHDIDLSLTAPQAPSPSPAILPPSKKNMSDKEGLAIAISVVVVVVVLALAMAALLVRRKQRLRAEKFLERDLQRIGVSTLEVENNGKFRRTEHPSSGNRTNHSSVEAYANAPGPVHTVESQVHEVHFPESVHPPRPAYPTNRNTDGNGTKRKDSLPPHPDRTDDRTARRASPPAHRNIDVTALAYGQIGAPQHPPSRFYPRGPPPPRLNNLANGPSVTISHVSASSSELAMPYQSSAHQKSNHFHATTDAFARDNIDYPPPSGPPARF